MATTHLESLRHWVWEANRGNPVRKNATLTLGRDGNLVLADADGRVAWQTNTANKGVVGLELLPNGNLVLHDSKGKFIWQSFDHPTDTLLVEGVDHFGSKYTTGDSTTRKDCGRKYSANCKGAGYFYHKKTSKCRIAYDLNTLTKFTNATHVGYIKVPNHL
ncbi:Epidermis-specific secreted glycoprotein EP1 [Morella rubra]|uniref:Epidermis-specific secreted glycoprotein EP1 n=1 Tax=Morella rubra TaxID=262757 RepID=A0A6A1W7C9_9ROSI|nr:Epidermis-specific secreted glycoprotein EP1 [Morella rubra]